MPEDQSIPLLQRADGPRSGVRKTVVENWNRLVWQNGLVCAPLAAVLSSLALLFVKLLPRTSPFGLALLRSLIALPSTLALMHGNGIKRAWNRRRNLPWLILRGFAGCATMVCIFMGVRLLPLEDAQTMFMMHPAFICIAAYCLLGERMHSAQVAGLVMSFAGAVLVLQPPLIFGGKWNASPLGLMLSLMAAICVTAVYILVRIVADTESTITMTLWLHLTDIAICIPFLLVGWPQPMVFNYSSKEWAFLACAGLTTFGCQLMMNRGAQLMSAGTAGSFGPLEVPLAFMWGVVVFHEQISLVSCGGAVLVVLGLLAVSARR